MCEDRQTRLGSDNGCQRVCEIAQPTPGPQPFWSTRGGTGSAFFQLSPACSSLFPSPALGLPRRDSFLRSGRLPPDDASQCGQPRRTHMNSALQTEAAVHLCLWAETAADLMMTSPVSLRADATLGEAVALLTDRGFSAAPVIDEAGRPI